MNTFKNHWAVFGFDVDSLEVGQGADSGISTVVGKRSSQRRQVGNFMPVSNFMEIHTFAQVLVMRNFHTKFDNK